MFLDSATLRENVVSIARNIGYLPKSRKAARATVSFFVNTSAISPPPVSLTLRKGPIATSAKVLPILRSFSQLLMILQFHRIQRNCNF